MKKVEKLEPVFYIHFDNGVEIKYETLLKELEDMMYADFTEFNLNDAKDVVILEWIKNSCKEDEISYETTFNHTTKVYWSNNESLIERLEKEIYDLVYSKEN